MNESRVLLLVVVVSPFGGGGGRGEGLEGGICLFACLFPSLFQLAVKIVSCHLIKSHSK